MTEHSDKIDYVEYISRYKSRNAGPQVTWTELEGYYNQLAAKYAGRWPHLPVKVTMYSALYRLIETFWPLEEKFPRIDTFSFHAGAWPRDSVTESELSSSPDSFNAADTTTEKHQVTGPSCAASDQVSSASRELCEAANALCHVSQKLSNAFE